MSEINENIEQETSEVSAKEMKEKTIGLLKEEIEYLEVRCQYEELMTRIEIAQRNRMVAYRDKAALVAEQKNAEEAAKKEEKETDSPQPTSRKLKTN